MQPKAIFDLSTELQDDWPRLLNEEQVEQLLAKAVHAQKAGQVVNELIALPADCLSGASQDLCQRLGKTLSNIRKRIERERQLLTERLSSLGIEGQFDDISIDTQSHRLGLQASVKEVDAIVPLLADLGFACSLPLKRGAWQAYRRAYNSTSFIRIDDVTFRLDLRWDLPAKSKLAQRLAPRTADLKFAEFSSTLWPLYYGVRLVRPLLNRIKTHSNEEPLWPFLGTPSSLIPELLNAVGLSADDRLLDIGCGDGRILIEAVRSAGCHATGIELDPELVALAKDKLNANGLLENIKIIEGNGLDAFQDDATVVFLFLPVRSLPQLVPALLERLVPGARILAHEQEALPAETPPHVSRVICSEDSLSVAHIWER